MIAGRYTLEHEIGRGGMGAVYLGRDEVLGRRVAMKRIGVLPGGRVPDLARAEREARLAARVNHPHVVAVFDLVDDDGGQWLVMELVEGTTLAELLRDRGSLTPDEAAPLLAQAADALAAAHAAGIVHRDVKPSNILVTPSGQVKLSDFGIARAEADASLTATGLVTGSPSYLAPEVAAGGSATAASDVWSLGATLYHALAGEPPYDARENVLGALYRIVHEEPPRLADAGWLTPVLDGTMTRDPALRWPMSRVRDVLAAGAGAVPPVDTRPVAPPPRPGTDREAVSPALGDRTRPIRTAAPAPPVRGSHRGGVRAALVAAAAALLLGLIGWLALRGDDEPERSAGSSPSGRATAASPTDGDTSVEGPTAAGMEQFVRDYLATVVRDRRAAFAMLTPQMQRDSNGFAGYDGFWRTVRSAEVLSVSADAAALTVSYDVQYTRTSGGSWTDSVSLQLAFENGDYLVAGEL